jgi:hypothetical protein
MAELFNVPWPVGLSLRDIKQLCEAAFSHKLPSFLPDVLESRGISLTPDEARALYNALRELSAQSGFCILDDDPQPEVWGSELPSCILNVVGGTYFDYRNMKKILATFDGEYLPESLSEDERYQALRAARRQPVIVRPCRECGREIVITLATVAHAIRAYHLIERGDLYEPSTLCTSCRDKRDEALAEQRSQPRKPKPKNKGKDKRGMTFNLGEQAPQLADVDIPEPQDKEEDNNVDQSTTDSSRVTVPVSEEAQPVVPQPQEAPEA